MPEAVKRMNVLRARSGHARVTYVELFFDLVFVFAITQLSHHLLEHFTLHGVAETALLLMAVWWVWVFTSWATNWLDPQTTPVRVLLFLLMLAGLVLSTSIPQAFGDRAMAFAGAYVFMQLARTLFLLWALYGHSPANFRNFQRILAWLSLSAVFWIAGACVDGNLRFAIWGIALLIEYVAPSASFRVPGLGRSSTTDWDIDAAHMAERCALFIIIALGESVLVTGATFGKMPWTTATVASFVVSFIGSVAMWWIYFNIGAERGSLNFSASDDRGRIARLAYTYIHLLPVAGILVAAVADELVLAHPLGHTDFKIAATVIGGPVLFLAGNILFKRAVLGRPAWSHWVGLGLIAALTPLASVLPPLAFNTLATAALIVVAGWETWSLRSMVVEMREHEHG